MNFALFSDDLCRARYLESVLLPIGGTRIDVYEIEPGQKSHWVVVQQKDGEKTVEVLYAARSELF